MEILVSRTSDQLHRLFIHKNSSSSLTLLGHRFYDPVAKRFLTPDGFMVENFDEMVNSRVSANLYSYASNNPITRVDPTGDFDTEILLFRDIKDAYNNSLNKITIDTNNSKIKRLTHSHNGMKSNLSSLQNKAKGIYNENISKFDLSNKNYGSNNAKQVRKDFHAVSNAVDKLKKSVQDIGSNISKLKQDNVKLKNQVENYERTQNSQENDVLKNIGAPVNIQPQT